MGWRARSLPIDPSGWIVQRIGWGVVVEVVEVAMRT
jgi:hypothetical protein